MRKWLLSILILTLAVVLMACGSDDNEESSNEEEAASGDSKWEEIQEEGELVVGTSGTLYPASFYPEDSDELTGYDVEIMKEIADRLDLEISFEEYGVDGLLSAIDSGRVDVVANDMEVTNSRDESFDFSEPYKHSYATMIVREDDLSGIETLEDIEGKVHGGGATTVFAQIAEHYGAEIESYGNVTNDVYLRDVENGRTDLIINDYYLQSLALQALPELEVTQHPDLQFHPSDSAIVMGEGEEELKEKMDETLNEMREDGTLTELSEEFFGGKDASQEPEEDVEEIEGLDL
ncbi:putative ABC transporter extracellular-binding protein YckB [Halobacillus andaensis]|uniref:ABC transporter extracellular-binding protein YckB n=1 Tax=Halobacillus andaensis TaxID=1176239 RepID=A0A917EWD4_HALAA|nr:transporter substrate-binding domain-containing protein [Halobacillus andaensis]MBP2005951.1 cystine transport system substrate-binding protein [Halobacillus andaensis]GGF24765.1 putative ABC transporter extracellular-binding protein YckB [Halobacillus andaensis]